MATDSLVPAGQPGGIHNTLSGTTADVVNVTGVTRNTIVEIVNRHATNAMYARSDGTTAVAEANGTVWIGPNGGSAAWKQNRGANIAYSIVGTDNPYSVHAVDEADWPR